MFEKLKEYGLYIILGLVALGALGYMYVSTINNNKGAELKKNIQYTFIDGMTLKDTKAYQNKTVTGLMNDITGKTFGGKKIDGDNLYLINQDGLLATIDGRLPKLLTPQQVKKLYYNGDPSELKLFLIPLVNSNLVDTNNLDGILQLKEDEINEINTNGGIKDILSDMNGNGSSSSGTKNIKDLSDFSRGYIGEGYFGLGLFDTEQDAIDFANSYFNGAEVVQVSDNGKYGVFFEIVGGGSSANYNIDTLRCDGVTRETQNQLNNKNEQVNELLDRELDYINTINQKNQELVDKENEKTEAINQCNTEKTNAINEKEQEKNTAINQCLQQKQEAIEQKETEKTEAVNQCNTEKNEAISAKEQEKTTAINTCNSEKEIIQTQLNTCTTQITKVQQEVDFWKAGIVHTGPSIRDKEGGMSLWDSWEGRSQDGTTWHWFGLYKYDTSYRNYTLHVVHITKTSSGFTNYSYGTGLSFKDNRSGNLRCGAIFGDLGRLGRKVKYSGSKDIEIHWGYATAYFYPNSKGKCNRYTRHKFIDINQGGTAYQDSTEYNCDSDRNDCSSVPSISNGWSTYVNIPANQDISSTGVSHAVKSVGGRRDGNSWIIQLSF